jgi:drug/metabolite transporter (DMT)-like permease
MGRPYLWMLLGALAFASMGAMAHALKQHCDWQVIALARAIFPLVCVGGLAAASGVRLVFFRPRSLWVRSIAGSLSLVCTFFAFTRMPISDVITLTNLFPVWVAVLSWPLLHHAPSREVWLAVAGGVLGVVLIQQPHLGQGNLASVAALAASFFSGVAMIGLHRLQGIDSRAIVTHFSAVSLAFCFAALGLFDHGADLFGRLVPRDIWLLLGVGASATIGQVFLTKAFGAGPPAKVAVVGLTQVGFGMLYDVLLFGGSFTPTRLAGIALVVTPTAWLLSRGAVEVEPAD